jgi:hypothetical protein
VGFAVGFNGVEAISRASLCKGGIGPAPILLQRGRPFPTTRAVSDPLPSARPDGLSLADLPSGETLLELERQARQGGSSLLEADLHGLWCLERVWPKGKRQPSALAGVALRSLAASLRIEATGSPAGRGEAPLQLTNAVRLGPLELRFLGPGRLQGKRPLLLFHFERLQIRAGNRLLLERVLPAPDPRRQAFFALIALGPSRSWLAARGRSGGLAVWRLSPPPHGSPGPQGGSPVAGPG